MKLLDTLERAFSRIPRGAKLALAVSGGADSTALLYGTAAIWKGDFFVVHVNHALRPDAECAADEEAVRRHCESLRAPFFAHRIERGAISAYAREKNCGEEAAARHFRLSALRDVALQEGASFILTAHTKNDSIETALFRFLRGSGPRGLALMPFFAHVKGCEPRVLRLCRPLLEAERVDIEAYLAENSISYRTDSTNSSLAYSRNRLRLVLMPLLDEYFPSWREGVTESAAIQRNAADFIDAELKKRAIFSNFSKNTENDSIFIENYESLPLFLREESIFYCIDALKRGVEARRSVVRRFAENTAIQKQDLGGGVTVERGAGGAVVALKIGIPAEF